MKRPPYTYAICRLDHKFWPYINQELKDRGYKHIRAIIPVVKVPLRSKAGHNDYKEVPLLFNYGFIRMNTEKAFDRQFLRKLKTQIPGITGWVHNTVTMHPRKQRKRIDNAEDWDDFSQVATVKKSDIKFYRRMARSKNIYSKADVINLKIGEYITLHGYPFEGMGAQVLDINLTTKYISLGIPMGKGNIEVQMPLDQVLYSIYNDFNEEEFINKSKNKNIENYGDLSGESMGMFD